MRGWLIITCPAFHPLHILKAAICSSLLLSHTPAGAERASAPFPAHLAHPLYLKRKQTSYTSHSPLGFSQTRTRSLTRWHFVARLYFRTPWWFRERI